MRENLTEHLTSMPKESYTEFIVQEIKETEEKDIISSINKETLKKARCIAIFGNIGSGKTAMAYYIIDNIKEDRKVFFYKHPCPKIIMALGYNNLISLEQLHNIRGSIVYIDEPQFYFNKKCDTKALMSLMQMSRQYGITLIISSSDTRVFSKSVESYFDFWIVKNVDYDLVKQGSKIKRILEENSIFGNPSEIELETNEFFAYSKIDREEVCCKRHFFKLPSYYSENHSKSYLAYNQPKGEK